MRKWFSNGVLGSVASLLVLTSTAIAATPTPNPNAGQGLEISPPVIELTADPGQTVVTVIRVRNVTSGTLIVKGEADDFGAGVGEEGQPQLLLDETGATRYSLKYWIQSVPDFVLAPQELKSATIKIVVPKNAEPGGHFGVARFTGVPPNLSGTGVALSASLGSLILMKVSGSVTDKVSLVQYTSVRKGNAATFFQTGPVDFLTRVKNEGTVHEKVEGTITVYDTFGKRIAVLNVNDKGGNALPDSIRKFTTTLDIRSLFGHYTAKLALTYGTGQKINATTTFWVIPVTMILIVVFILIVLFFLLRFALRKYNNYVIAQARKR